MLRSLKIYKLVALLLVFNISFAARCGGPSDNVNKQPDTKTRRIIIAADDFAEGQKSVARLLATARDTDLISQEDVNEIKPFLQQANDLNAKAIEYGKKLIQNPQDSVVEKDLVGIINQISAVLVRANNAGLLRIKDLKTREAFSLLIITMQNAVTSIIVTLKEN